MREISGLLSEIEMQKMIDLHGLSPEQSRLVVSREINQQLPQFSKLRFVTGRGNHINRKGKKGILFRKFPNWLPEDAVSKDLSVKKFDGFYEVSMKTKNQANSPEPIISELYVEWLRDNIQQIKKFAEQGDSECQIILGRCYAEGMVVEQNYKKAAKYYQLSANSGNVDAKYLLGGCYWQGQGVFQSDQKAIALFKEAAAQNDASAYMQLGDIYYYGQGVKKNLTTASENYEKASDLGLNAAKRRLAHLYFYGWGVPENKAKAFGLYKVVADNGDAHSAYNVAIAYHSGQGVSKNLEYAFKYAKQSADMNDPDAQYLVYLFYLKGVGVAKDRALSCKYQKRSADNGCAQALFSMSFYPQKNSSLDSLWTYLVKAAKANHILAQILVLQLKPKLIEMNLLSLKDMDSIRENFWSQDNCAVLDFQDTQTIFGVIDFYIFDLHASNGNPTKKQKTKIIKLLLALEKKQYPQAYHRHGLAHHIGSFVKKNRQQAKNYYLKGAKLNDAGCLCCLGYFYEEEAKTDPRYYKQAFEYHQKAAEQGSANSYNQLGNFYSKGAGVEKNTLKAEECYRKAIQLYSDDSKLAHQKINLFPDYHAIVIYSHATYNLGTLLLVKDGGSSDYWREAISLLLKSEEAGYTQAKVLVDKLLGFEVIKQWTFAKNYINTDKVSRGYAALWLEKAASRGHKAAQQIIDELGLIPRAKPQGQRCANQVGFWEQPAQPTEMILLSKKEELAEFSRALKLDINWKTPKADRAWGYLDSAGLSILEKLSIDPFTIRKTKDGKYVLLLEALSTHTLSEITNKIIRQVNNNSLIFSGGL